jgi:cytoskeletal protein RodZ
MAKAGRQPVAEGKTQISGIGGSRGETTLGQFLTDARKSGGYTPEQVAAETHIPSHYIRAIETDDYGLISDQLYLLPFVRRYAAFVGLDPEDVASRFVHDVQKAESTAAKTNEPIAMITRERRSGGGRYLVLVIVLIVAAVTGFLMVKRPTLLQGVLHLSEQGSFKIESHGDASVAGPASRTSDSAPAVPFETSVTPAAASDDPSAEAPTTPRPPEGSGSKSITR